MRLFSGLLNNNPLTRWVKNQRNTLIEIKYKIANIQLSKIVSLLGKILGIVVKEQEGLQLYNKIEEIRSLSKASRGTKNKKKIKD